MRRLHYRPAAGADIRRLLKTSRRMFGARARRDYKLLIDRGLHLLCADPQRPGVSQRDELEQGQYLFHLRHARMRGAAPKQPRHLIVFTYDDATLTILRVLHDAMDLERHIGNEETE